MAGADGGRTNPGALGEGSELRQHERPGSRRVEPGRRPEHQPDLDRAVAAGHHRVGADVAVEVGAGEPKEVPGDGEPGPLSVPGRGDEQRGAVHPVVPGRHCQIGRTVPVVVAGDRGAGQTWGRGRGGDRGHGGRAPAEDEAREPCGDSREPRCDEGRGHVSHLTRVRPARMPVMVPGSRSRGPSWSGRPWRQRGSRSSSRRCRLPAGRRRCGRRSRHWPCRRRPRRGLR